ncbi:MAG TPA: hypothetical protein VF713_10500, partial [Thermoanaerobaculia bacterium]
SETDRRAPHASAADRRPAGNTHPTAFTPLGTSVQRTFGNHAVNRGLQGARDSGGFDDTVSDDQDLDAGATLGESVGDVGRQVGTFFGNVFGGLVGAVAGNDISSLTTLAPDWRPHGAFRWNVSFSTGGRNGWIIQRMENSRRAEDASGAPLPDSITPRLWEAWAVDGTGNISPSKGTANDLWSRKGFGAGSQGHWSATSALYFTTTDPATQGFVPRSVPEAGKLPATTTEPSGLGIARLHRYAQGTWDSTGPTPTHTGSAGPQ